MVIAVPVLNIRYECAGYLPPPGGIWPMKTVCWPCGGANTTTEALKVVEAWGFQSDDHEGLLRG